MEVHKFRFTVRETVHYNPEIRKCDHMIVCKPKVIQVSLYCWGGRESVFRKVIQKKGDSYSKSLKSTKHHQNQQVIPFDKYIIYFVESEEDRKATNACHVLVENSGALSLVVVEELDW